MAAGQAGDGPYAEQPLKANPLARDTVTINAGR